ncbi:hypothetical protein CCACVL1_23983, partial [Corchorus capsularis]
VRSVPRYRTERRRRLNSESMVESGRHALT